MEQLKHQFACNNTCCIFFSYESLKCTNVYLYLFISFKYLGKVDLRAWFWNLTEMLYICYDINLHKFYYHYYKLASFDFEKLRIYRIVQDSVLYASELEFKTFLIPLQVCWTTAPWASFGTAKTCGWGEPASAPLGSLQRPSGKPSAHTDCWSWMLPESTLIWLSQIFCRVWLLINTAR